jgi:hypothetical protein
MKEASVILLIFCFPLFLHAQFSSNSLALPIAYAVPTNAKQSFFSKKKLFQHNRGAILGLQRGAATSIELGAEAHWRKLSLLDPNIFGANANLNYNFGHHVIGYNAGMWMKHGRVNLTYGGNLVYYSNFKGLSRYGGGPTVGFRLAGFHLINGYNFLAGDKELTGANSLYISLRYYFPVENKFTWDRKTMKKKKERKKEREKRKKQKEEEKENGERKGLLDWFKKSS